MPTDPIVEKKLASRCRRPSNVRRVMPPLNSAVADWYDGANLIDAYAITLPSNAPEAVDELARAALTTPPAWFLALLGLRDAIVSFVGVKTTRRMQEEAKTDNGKPVAFFPILGRSFNELILGEDDRHLDFRASVMVRASVDDASRELLMITVVRCHNLMGRIYLRAITPFHCLIVRSNLARLADKYTRLS